jgi:hypothetical protein
VFAISSPGLLLPLVYTMHSHSYYAFLSSCNCLT